MNAIAKIVVSLAVVAAPTFVFAQSQNGPLTRAQVKAELVQLERAGYSPATGEDANYPADIQAAEAKVAAQHDTNKANEAYGGTCQRQCIGLWDEAHAHVDAAWFVASV